MGIKTRLLQPVRPRTFLSFAGLAAMIAALVAATGSKSQLQGQSSQAGSAGTSAPRSHFHHIHLNGTDPLSAIKFYTSKFDCEQAKLGGAIDAVWAQKSWILINKVQTAPPWQLTSAIWHFGWGAEDMQATYQKQLDSGTKFFTPITQLAPSFYFAYVEGPDHALIELNTANHHHFGHLHLFSED
ncbi:MAG TPA: VOC family protein, partial [Blastocatellia bacterium]|nr:VOC family protein [Blastocatellia bacterium]